MKTIFITGVAGFLGSHLAKYFLRFGYKVKGCDSLIGGYASNVPVEVEWHKTDILNNTELAAIMKNCDIVIHTAALPYEGLSVFSPKIVAENIYSGTVSVASAAIQNKVSLFINCISMARYGALKPPFVETMICKPQDPYGIAKHHAEQHLNLLSDIHGLKVIHVIPHNIIGTHQKYDDPFRNVVSIMINRCLQDKSIIIYGDGSQVRSFSGVTDCLEAIAKLVFTHELIENKEIFNIGPDNNEITIKELAYKVANICKKYPNLQYFPDRPQEVKLAYCSSDKARDVLGYQPRTNIDTVIKEMVEWIKGRGTKEFTYHLPIEIVNDKVPRTWTEQIF